MLNIQIHRMFKKPSVAFIILGQNSSSDRGPLSTLGNPYSISKGFQSEFFLQNFVFGPDPVDLLHRKNGHNAVTHRPGVSFL